MSDIKFEVVNEVPSITRPSTNSKYRPIVTAAVENEGQAIKVPFEDNKTAHSRAGSVRAITNRHDEAERFTVVVRGSDLYVTFGANAEGEEAEIEDEGEEAPAPAAPAKKKPARKRTAARRRS